MSKKKLILFNLNGSLLMSNDRVIMFWCDAIRNTGLQPNYGIIFQKFNESFEETIIPLLVEAGSWTDLQTQRVIEHAKKIFHDENISCSVGLTAKIKALKTAGYTLGIITSQSSKYLAKSLLNIGLNKDIFTIVKTSDDGIKKPDPRVFDSALELFKAEEIIFVGNCPHQDLAPVSKRGISFAAITSKSNPKALFAALGVADELIYKSVIEFIDDFLQK